MKVGDYVRYVDVFNNTIKIRKINEIIPPDMLIKKDVYFFNNKECSLKEDIKLTSPRIIDLIEIGDYVNGYRVAEIETLPTKQKLVVVGYGYDADEISENNIKSIVTKEQFEAMQYKVGE